MVKIFHTKRALISGLGGGGLSIFNALFHIKKDTEVNNPGMPFLNTALLCLIDLSTLNSNFFLLWKAAMGLDF